jgi:hypothetical protein
VGVLRRSRWPAGSVALAIAWLGTGAHAAVPGATPGAGHAGRMLYVEAGYGQATYAFKGDGAPTLTRHLLDLEGGLSRPIAAGGALRLGSSLSLMPPAGREWDGESYALVTFDMLKLAYTTPSRVHGRAGLGPFHARGGLGFVRVFAPVNEVAIGLSATVGCDVGPLFVGLKGRTARFEVDFEPHGTPPDTKYKLYYAGIVLGPALRGD